MIDRRYFEEYDRLMRHWHGGIDETIIAELCMRCESYPEAYFATHLDLILALIEMGDLEDARGLILRLAEKGYWLDRDWITKHLALDDQILALLSRNRNCDPDDPQAMLLLKRAAHPTDQLAVVLHGWGQTPGLMQYHLEAPELTKDYDRLYLRSSDRLGSELYHWPEGGETTRRITALIEKVIRDYREVLFIGFGQGGGLAMNMSLAGDHPGARFLAIAPTIPLLESVAPAEKESLLISGGEDPLQLAHEMMVQRLKASGVPLNHELVPEMGHHFPEGMEKILREMLLR